MCRAQRVLLVLRVKPGDDLARREHIAHMDGPLDHASVEAKREADLVLGANLACQRNGLAFRAALDGNSPDGTDLGTGLYCFAPQVGAPNRPLGARRGDRARSNNQTAA